MSIVLRLIYLGMSLLGLIVSFNQGQVPVGLGTPSNQIAVCALFLWIASETYVRRDFLYSIVAIIVTAVFGVGCGLPFYLFLRGLPQKWW